MIRVKSKEIVQIVYQSRIIANIHKQSRVVFDYIRSCFGRGWWVNDRPWSNDNNWKNY